MKYLLVICLLLTGCAGMHESGLQKMAERDAKMMTNVFGPVCERNGMSKDTPDYMSCVLALQGQQNQRAAQSATAYQVFRTAVH